MSEPDADSFMCGDGGDEIFVLMTLALRLTYMKPR